MKLATIRTPDGTRAVRVDGDALVGLDAPDVGALLSNVEWPAKAAARGISSYPLGAADFAPLVPHPCKVICVGHNYRNHVQEMGREPPAYPTLFPKFADSLIGANDDIPKAPETEALDWEVELVVVIGRRVRRATESEAEAAIAGFTVMNDVSVRAWQFRTVEWTQGKGLGLVHPAGPVPRHSGRTARRRTARVGGQHRRRRPDDAARQHQRPALRSGRPGAVHLHDHPAQCRRLHRYRDTRRSRPRPRPEGLPRWRRNGGDPDRASRRVLEPGRQGDLMARAFADARRWASQGTTLFLGAVSGLDETGPSNAVRRWRRTH